MSRLVSDLLTLAAADVEEHPIHRVPLELNALIEEVHHSALLLANDKVAVELELSEPVTVVGDADRLKQLFLNLIDNAVKFTPAGGIVSIAVCPDGDLVHVDVSDTGVGISEDEQEAIFRRFYRTEQSRSARGSGLGLSISAWIVEAHDGSIDVTSTPGEGSTFTVTLPVESAIADSA